MQFQSDDLFPPKYYEECIKENPQYCFSTLFFKEINTFVKHLKRHKRFLFQINAVLKSKNKLENKKKKIFTDSTKMSLYILLFILIYSIFIK